MMLTVETKDISPSNFRFDPHLGKSLRDRLRDTADSYIRRPFYKLRYGKKFSHLPYRVDLALPSRGMSSIARRYFIDRHLPLRNSRILVVGCGTAWDFGSYLDFQPREIVGVDLYNFASCWQQVQDYVETKKLSTKVSFYQSDIAGIANLNLGDFDIVCSDAVFEHCRDLEAVLKSLYALLRPHGIMYASYGPLWYSWGGDHFSGRGGIEFGYNHLLLSPQEFEEYYQQHLRDDNYEVQNGGRYIKLDLFSKLASKEYLDIYQKLNFKIKSLVLEFSDEEQVITPHIGTQVLQRHPHLSIDDLLIKTHLILLEK